MKNLNVGLISTRDIGHEASNVTNVYLKVVLRIWIVIPYLVEHVL